MEDSQLWGPSETHEEGERNSVVWGTQTKKDTV